ncbi:MAG TPA: class I SAM-dependent methyltransferase [Bryobacteraceae bacterium]|nr:class I SAM-dependent methyltransferase [Bryobacteraceae bacterium]
MTSAADRQTFLKQYAIIRDAEGRGSADAAYYRSLPYADLSGRNTGQWRIRSKSFDHFLRRVIAPLEKTLRRPLDVLDLGAGNGWLCWRLAQRGHRAIALDIFTDDRDGLGAIRKYAETGAVAADFDHLPFASASFDIAVYNASFHYSSDYVSTLKEVRRCLRPEGRIVILDSPLYRKAEHGETMRRERQAFFEGIYGFRSEALSSIEYLDEPRLRQLSRDLGIEWSRSQPWYGWKWAVRPWLARLRGKRPPSRFFLVSGRFL